MKMGFCVRICRDDLQVFNDSGAASILAIYIVTIFINYL